MRILTERHVPTGEVSEYIITDQAYNSNEIKILYGEGFTEQAKNETAIRLEDTGNGFNIDMSEGFITGNGIKSIEIDYAQAVNLLGLLLLTHKDYKFTVSSEPEKLN